MEEEKEGREANREWKRVKPTLNFFFCGGGGETRGATIEMKHKETNNAGAVGTND